MSEPIVFSCPHCETVSRVPREFAGQRGKCPVCQKGVQVPDPDAPPEPASPEPASPDAAPPPLPAPGDEQARDTKECPFCGEQVKAVAKKCRHCREFFREAAERAPTRTRPDDDDDVDDDGGEDDRRARPRGRSYGDYKPCPFCKCEEAEKVGFTWWGGIIGPGMLTHVRCLDCSRCFNGKTGESNDRAIAIYLGVGLTLALAICILGGVAVAMS